MEANLWVLATCFIFFAISLYTRIYPGPTPLRRFSASVLFFTLMVFVFTKYLSLTFGQITFIALLFMISTVAGFFIAELIVFNFGKEKVGRQK